MRHLVFVLCLIGVAACGSLPPPVQTAPGGVMVVGQPSSCSAAGNPTCAGCSVSCPAGKQASCREGEVHQTEGFSPVCWTAAKCECK